MYHTFEMHTLVSFPPSLFLHKHHSLFIYLFPVLQHDHRLCTNSLAGRSFVIGILDKVYTSTLRRSAVHHIPRTSHSHHHLESVIKLMCMLLVCGRKRVQRENPHRHEGTRTVYIEKNRSGIEQRTIFSGAAMQTTALLCR